MKAIPGPFIVVEGPDGSGKSSLVGSLAARLKAGGVVPVLVREPGGTPLAEAIRRELLDHGREFSPEAELLFLATARADLVHRVIRPALERGELVLSDRYDLSTRAYQEAGRGIEPDTVDRFNRAATGGLQPDLTLVLDVPPEVGMERQRQAGKVQDRLDLQDAGFQARVARCYASAMGPGIHHVDATGSAETVLDATWQVLQGRWPDIFR